MDPLDRLAAALADRYTIDRELGAGGMATVYLAHDIKHDRNVAIKVLHPDLGAALGGERFLTEIKTTAKLQHPHILPLLDSGNADGLLYYVMPVVTGESLRARLLRERQLPIDDVLRIAGEVGDALDAAHAIGIIHRDIKPENILLQGGHALVADFGIALAVQTAGGERMTQTGLSLGTPQYMSPEQAMGERTIDARSDVYALGAVTYEMLTGDPPFTGSSVQAIVAKVLTEKPTAPSRIRDTVSPGMEAAVLKALAKLPADRFASAAEFRRALGTEGSAPSRPVAASPREVGALSRARRTNVVLLILALVAFGVAARQSFRTPALADGPVHRLEFSPSADLHFAVPVMGTVTMLALSPDGERAVVSVERPGGWAFAIRSLDQLTAHILPGTEGGAYPTFSPDGQWIAFQGADGMIKKIAVDGTSLTNVCSLGGMGSSGITWISVREIAFAPQTMNGTGLYRVSADGGTPAMLASVDSAAGERYKTAPVATEDGKLVLYTSTFGSSADLFLGIARVSDGKSRLYPQLHGARVLGLIAGAVVYVRADGALMAAPFNSGTLAIGTSIQVGDSIAVRGWDAAAALASNGTLLYQEGGSAAQLVRVDMQGVATPLVDSVRPYVHPRFSPDGRRLVFEVTGVAGADVWVSDLVSKALQRVTNGGVNDRPEWSPDGKRVMYSTAHERPYELWWQPIDGSAPMTKVLGVADEIREGLITPDGKSVVYRIDTRTRNRDVLMVPLEGDHKPVPLLTSIYDEKEPRVSPDMKWLAYVSNESGRYEVYVRSLAPSGGRVPVSTEGGGEPLWGPDSRHLYYRVADKLIEATLTTTPALGVATRKGLFGGPFATDIFHPDYDIAPDGKSFVMVKPAQDRRRLVLVTNWARELQRRMANTK